MLSYVWQSVKTKSYWKYAILSEDGFKTFFAVLGGAWTVIEILEFFKWLNKDHLPEYSLYFLIFTSLLIVILTRRPVHRIKYKIPGKDISIEVRIGNIFDCKGQKIISTNTTFDTDTANGIIALNSLQGQFTQKYFSNNINGLDQIVEKGLIGKPHTNFQKVSGKSKKYAFGTTVRIDIVNEIFYLLAMSDFNYNNTAHTTLENVLISIEAIFDFIAQKGENTDVVIPLVGTGRGRITANRKRVIALIAQLFVKASEQQHFSNKLIIVIHPNDVKNFGINLHEVRDLLNHYLP